MPVSTSPYLGGLGGLGPCLILPCIFESGTEPGPEQAPTKYVFMNEQSQESYLGSSSLSFPICKRGVFLLLLLNS